MPIIQICSWRISSLLLRAPLPGIWFPMSGDMLKLPVHVEFDMMRGNLSGRLLARRVTSYYC